MDYEEAKAGVNRVANACRVYARQWDSGNPPGHDAVMELHRALAKSTPQLFRPNLELASLRRLAEDLAVALESLLVEFSTREASVAALAAYRAEHQAADQ